MLLPPRLVLLVAFTSRTCFSTKPMFAWHHSCRTLDWLQGEWYDSKRDKTHVYNELYVLAIGREDAPTWRQVISPNG